jgi:hypothetical protein
MGYSSYMLRYDDKGTVKTADGKYYFLYNDDVLDKDVIPFDPNKKRGYVKRVININYQRNGVCGLGFYSINFEDEDGDIMNAVVMNCQCYNEDERKRGTRGQHKCDPACAVQRVDDIATNNLVNDFRGDRYFDYLNDVIESYYDANFPFFLAVKPQDAISAEIAHFEAIGQSLGLPLPGSKAKVLQ